LVSLLLINNEIGTILQVEEVVVLCKKYRALFHSDTVQAIGHYAIDLQKSPIDFMVASAHKFHGPKGVGFAYFKKGFGILPMIHGGGQEKGARSSTENVHGIMGMEKALSVAMFSLDSDTKRITELKKYFISELKKLDKNIQFNGVSSDLENSSYLILNVRFPVKNDLLLFSLDIAGIAVSGGSACQSGSNKGSHVLAEILLNEEADNTSIRFSFSKFTVKEELDITLSKLKELL
jgi:cysteine desulfurase